MFAGFYYWIEKIVGLQYDTRLANMHFTLFFIGVNITFMPLHFLGLSGMPRRIVDYPDFYHGWNQISTLGSTISFISAILFFYLVYDMFVYGKPGRKAPYVIKLLTQMQLVETLLKLQGSSTNKKALIIKGLIFSLFADAPNAWQFGFQDPATPLMEGITDFHHDVMFFIIWIVLLVSWLLIEFFFYTEKNKLFTFLGIKKSESETIMLPSKIQHNTILEIVWTLIPCFILLLIAIPSFSLLYAVEDLSIIESTIKIIGNQWYWSYELPGNNFEKKFDSVMVPEADLETGWLRLLEVDERLLLPVERQLRLFITASDVLHSFAVPSLGVKLDACPGRLNQVGLWIKRTGVYYGQCSEICGVHHAFMPIVIEAVEEDNYLKWLLPDISKYSL